MTGLPQSAAMLLLLLGTSQVRACVETYVTNPHPRFARTLIKNQCGWPVSVSHCFGAECIPPDIELIHLNANGECEVAQRSERVSTRNWSRPNDCANEVCKT
jgi:hypothetical protein